MVRVVDGDTIDVQRDGAKVRIRLIGIDTPEVHPSDKMDRDVRRHGRSAETIRAAGARAAAYATEALLHRQVMLSYDVQRTDRYGRTLAYVWLDGERLFNREIVCAGMARLSTIPPNVAYVGALRICEREARDAGRGLWADTPPSRHPDAPVERGEEIGGERLDLRPHRGR